MNDMSKLFRNIFLAIVVPALMFMNLSTVLAQGGPPMLTDDSSTPGNGNWENNFSVGFQGTSKNYLLAFPQLDLNYGLGERIQLKIEAPWVKEGGEPLANKFDHITLGMKYMLLDEDSDGIFLSVYPQPIISFNPDDHTNRTEYGIILPVAASKQFFKTGVNVQIGYQVLGSEKEIFYGLVVDHPLGKYLLVLGEIHSTIGRKDVSGSFPDDEIYFRAGTFVNLGIQFKPSDAYFINLAAGKDIESGPIFTSSAKYYGYLGLQLNM
jgi:hypothetical protein